MTKSSPPLAARMRPNTLDEVVGQRHLLDSGSRFRTTLGAGRLGSLLLWGPPGCGKTTIARLLAGAVDLQFRQISAVMDGIKELRAVVHEASQNRLDPRGTLLFVDEIHRWSKAQQDALLPHVEEGTVTLVGATTENPAFQVIPPLRSRCQLLVLQPLDAADLCVLVERAMADGDTGLGGQDVELDPAVPGLIAEYAAGDARRALSLLERAVHGVAAGERVSVELLGEILGSKDLLHDATGDAHFDVVSAFIKSLRGSDPDAALYWMARMREGGEDPTYVARRMLVFASEDVGNAEPRALPLAMAAHQAAHVLGMPEARIVLGQTCTFLATAPKSNASYRAVDAALAEVRRSGGLPVPFHLRNAPTSLARKLGHGEGYLYPHDHPDCLVEQAHLPDGLRDARFYEPVARGAEKVIGERLAWWRARLAGASEESG